MGGENAGAGRGWNGAERGDRCLEEKSKTKSVNPGRAGLDNAIYRIVFSERA